MDLHAGQLQGFFSVPVDHMTALAMIADYASSRAWKTWWWSLRTRGHEDCQTDGRPLELLCGRALLRRAQRPGKNVIGEWRARRPSSSTTSSIPWDLVNGAQALLDKGQSCLRGPPRCCRSGLRRIAASPQEAVVTDTIPLREGADHSKIVTFTAGILADTIRNVFVDDSLRLFKENQLFWIVPSGIREGF